MPIEILMPALSPTMTEGNLVKWHKKEGDVVKSGDVIAEIETDKATMEVDTPDEGRLGKILVPEGTEGVQVNQVIALLLEEGEDSATLENIKMGGAPKQAQKPETLPSAPESKPDLKVIPSQRNSSGDRVFATPLARRLSENAGLNVQSISGSGPHGRVVKADVDRVLSGSNPVPLLRPSVTSVLLSGYEPDYDVLPVSNVRKVIAKRLVDSKQTVPHFYLTIDCDIDSLLKARKQINEKANEAYKLSVNDFVIKACAHALKQKPRDS